MGYPWHSTILARHGHGTARYETGAGQPGTATVPCLGSRGSPGAGTSPARLCARHDSGPIPAPLPSPALPQNPSRTPQYRLSLASWRFGDSGGDKILAATLRPPVASSTAPPATASRSAPRRDLPLLSLLSSTATSGTVWTRSPSSLPPYRTSAFAGHRIALGASSVWIKHRRLTGSPSCHSRPRRVRYALALLPPFLLSIYCTSSFPGGLCSVPPPLLCSQRVLSRLWISSQAAK